MGEGQGGVEDSLAAAAAEAAAAAAAAPPPPGGQLLGNDTQIDGELKAAAACEEEVKASK